VIGDPQTLPVAQLLQLLQVVGLSRQFCEGTHFGTSLIRTVVLHIGRLAADGDEQEWAGSSGSGGGGGGGQPGAGAVSSRRGGVEPGGPAPASPVQLLQMVICLDRLRALQGWQRDELELLVEQALRDAPADELLAAAWGLMRGLYGAAPGDGRRRQRWGVLCRSGWLGRLLAGLEQRAAEEGAGAAGGCSPAGQAVQAAQAVQAGQAGQAEC
jgi:hypothetical protein